MMYIKKNILRTIFIIIVFSVFGCAGVEGPSQNKQQSGFSDDGGALPVYEGYVGENPDSVKSGNKLGVWYLKTGRIDKAISAFEATLAKEPKEPYATYYLGLAYLGKENYEKAIQVWQGYTNKDNPVLVEAISRQMTLLRIAQSRKFAAKAISQEKKLITVKPDANTVAVCYYEDLSPDKSLHAFRKALAAMIISDLSKIKSIKVVERIRLQALLEEMKLGQTGLVKQDTAPKVGKLLGAGNIVLGNLSLGSIKAVTTLASTDAEKIKGSGSASVEKDKFFTLPAIIIKDIAKIMGIKLTDKDKKAIVVVHTKVYEALVNYGYGLDALDAGKWAEAKNYFDMALKEDPNFDLAIEAAYSCPDENYPNVNNIIKLKGVKLSAAIESLMSSAESKLILDNSTAIDFLNNTGFTETDILGIDIGDLGLTGVGEETIEEDNINDLPPPPQPPAPPANVDIPSDNNVDYYPTDAFGGPSNY